MGTTINHTRPGWKICTACREEKRLEDFYKSKPTGDGLSHWCKPCTKWKQAERKIISRVKSRQAEELAPPPAPGFCRAFVDLGVGWEGLARCSFRAKEDGYCLTHIPKESKAKHANRWSHETIIEAIWVHAQEHDALPTADLWKTKGPWPSYNAVVRHFGTWANAIEQAGFPRPQRGVYVGERRGPRGPYKKKPFPRPGSSSWHVKERAILDGLGPEISQLIAEQDSDARTHSASKPWEVSLYTQFTEDGDPMIAFIDENGAFLSPRRAISRSSDAAWVEPLIELIDAGLTVDDLVLEAA